MRCPDCNKFVSFDEPAVEMEDPEISSGSVTASARVALNCAECGTELAEATFDLETEFEHECEDEDILCVCGHAKKYHGKKRCEPENESRQAIPCTCTEFSEMITEDDIDLEVDFNEPTVDDYYDPQFKTNKKGEKKPVPSRYQKHYYRVAVSGTLTCERCNKVIEVEMSEAMPASSFEECC